MTSTCGTVPEPTGEDAQTTLAGSLPAFPCEHSRKRGRPARSAEETALEMAREAVWLDQVRRDFRVAEIARREGLSKRRVQLGVARARHREEAHRARFSPTGEFLRIRDAIRNSSGPGSEVRALPVLVPIFPIGSFTPRSTCPHHGPIAEGSSFCCMVCHRSGRDDHPALQRDPRNDPRPEPRPATSEPSDRSKSRLTRKERRKALRQTAA